MHKLLAVVLCLVCGTAQAQSGQKFTAEQLYYLCTVGDPDRLSDMACNSW